MPFDTQSHRPSTFYLVSLFYPLDNIQPKYQTPKVNKLKINNINMWQSSFLPMPTIIAVTIGTRENIFLKLFGR